MAKKVLSIETGVYWTKVCLVDYKKAVPHVYAAFSFPTPEHAIEDGYIREREKFSHKLQEELLKHRITEKSVIFSINSSRVVTREVNLPEMKEKQLDGVVQSQAREYFPMDVANYTIAYKSMGKVDTESGKQLKLQLVAVPDNLLNNYSTLAKEMGLEIVNFEYIADSAVAFLEKRFTENGVMVQLEERTTVISVVVDKTMVFQRVTPYGYGTVLSAVLEHPALGVKDEREAFRFLALEDVLHHEPKLADFPKQEGMEEEKRQELLSEAYDEVRDTLHYLVRVVNTALDYYKNQTKGELNGTLCVIGDGIKIAGLKELIEAEVPVPVVQPDFASMIHTAGNKNEELFGELGLIGFLSCIGASTTTFEIRPKEQIGREQQKNAMLLPYLGLGGTVVICIFLVAASGIRYFLASSEHNRLQREIEKLSYIQEVYDENEAARQALAPYQEFDVSTGTKNEQFSELLAALEEQLPTTVSVQSITITESSINMNMTSDTKLTTAQMMINLKEIPFLSNISIPTMTEGENAAGGTIWQYTVVATYYSELEETAEAAAAALSQAETAETETTESQEDSAE